MDMVCEEKRAQKTTNFSSGEQNKKNPQIPQ